MFVCAVQGEHAIPSSTARYILLSYLLSQSTISISLISHALFSSMHVVKVVTALSKRAPVGRSLPKEFQPVTLLPRLSMFKFSIRFRFKYVERTCSGHLSALSSTQAVCQFTPSRYRAAHEAEDTLASQTV